MSSLTYKLFNFADANFDFFFLFLGSLGVYRELGGRALLVYITQGNVNTINGLSKVCLAESIYYFLIFFVCSMNKYPSINHKM